LLVYPALIIGGVGVKVPFTITFVPSVKQVHDAILRNRTEAHDELKERMGTEPPTSEINICVANVLELELRN
jgi:hypothetical protein